MDYLPWPESPIPANASATGKCRLANGVYALFHPDGSLRFLCRVVSAQVDCWLNLQSDSGHFDEGNSGEAYYRDGRMETFSPWDDSDPFPAKVSFAEWRDRVIAQVSRPVPAGAVESMDLELGDLRASCALNFRDFRDADWRLRVLGFLRRCQFGLPGFADSLSSWRETVVSKAMVESPWDRLLIEELPICAAPRPGLWRPDWSGSFAWKSEPQSWLLRTVAAFRPALEELSSVRHLAAFVGPGFGQPVCRLRGILFACELLCHLGEAKSAFGLARSLAPDLDFDATLAPWVENPQELELWALDWQACAPEEASGRHRAQLGVILQRMGMDSL